MLHRKDSGTEGTGKGDMTLRAMPNSSPPISRRDGVPLGYIVEQNNEIAAVKEQLKWLK